MSVTLVSIHVNWLNRFHCLVLMVDPLVLLVGFMVFLSLFLDTVRMCMGELHQIYIKGIKKIDFQKSVKK